MILSRRFCLKHSMQKTKSFNTLEYLIDIINQEKIQGCFVECGVWKGGTSMWMLTCQSKYNNEREIYLYDTFNGITIPSNKDVQIQSNELAIDIYNRYNGNWMVCPLEEVKNNISKVEYDFKNIHYIKGDIMNTLENNENIPEKISLLRLDTDWYESTKKELEILFPKLVKNGFVIIDDYYYWEGAKKATDEFFFQRPNIKYIFNHNSTRLVIQKM